MLIAHGLNEIIFSFEGRVVALTFVAWSCFSCGLTMRVNPLLKLHHKELSKQSLLLLLSTGISFNFVAQLST